jgi:uncharacterized protein YijF (DUF1287 family)
MSLSPFSLISLAAGVALIARGHLPAPAKLLAQFGQGTQEELANGSKSQLEENEDFGTRIAAEALHQVGKITDYDTSYMKIPFPNGDVPPTMATAADIVVRAWRGLGIDLQTRVYQDKSDCPGAYPKRNGSNAPDTNIDHRDVATLAAFFARRGTSLTVTHRAEDYKPGDIITCRVDGRQHIAIVVPSPVRGRCWIVHNLHWGARIEDKLFEYPIAGHFRYNPGF